MIGLADWAIVVEGDAGHVALVATSRGAIGVVYCGQIAPSGAGWSAIPGRDLTRVGVLDLGRAKHHATRDAAGAWLAEDAQIRARKYLGGMSGVGEAAASAIIKPIITEE